MGLSEATVRGVASQFALAGEIERVAPLGGGGAGGHINDSFRVEVQEGGGRRTYVLQRLNSRVFQDPVAVMENVVLVTRHLVARGHPTLILVSTRGGRHWHTDPDGAIWRLFVFVTGSLVRDSPEGPADAYAAGRAFGRFLRALADYEGPPLHETIAGFHDTRQRVARLEAVRGADPCGRAGAVRAELDALDSARGLADVLPPLLARGSLPLRIVHNDAKLSNVLLDERNGEPLCVVDLDTVMPGLALYDFGDLVRSVASPTAEDEEVLSRIGVSIPLFEALARGYLETAGAVLLPEEHSLLGFAGRLITFEQAVRFLTDHLEGDPYYRIERPGQNLTRCRAQLALLDSLSRHAASLEEILARPFG